jgi:thioesterase domain-containing protein
LSIRSGTGTPFFCVHADFGEPVALYALPLRGIERPILGIRAAGLVGDETVPNTVEAMAGRYADDIVAVQPTGPYVVGGYCIGGIVALEVARRLGDVERVILLDSFPPGTLLQPHVSASEAADLKALQRDSVLSRSFSAGPSVASWLRRRQDEIWRNNVLLTFGYQNQPVDFPISLIQSSNEALASYAQDYWRAVAGGRLDVYGIDTVHDDFIQSTEAGAVLRRLLTPLVPGSGE